MLCSLRRTLKLMALHLGQMPVPPPSMLWPGIVALSLWVALASLSGQTTPMWVVIAFLTGFNLQVAARLQNQTRGAKSQRISQVTVSIVGLGALAASTIVFLYGEPLWCQRWITLSAIVSVVIFVPDLWRDDLAIAKRHWLDSSWAGMRRQLSAAMILTGLTFAYLNEAMTQALAPEEWLVFWAVLHPLFWLTRWFVIDVVLIAALATPAE